MGNIVKAQIEIEGLRPLLQHRFTEDALPLEKQERTGVAGNDPEEWRKTAMITKNGQIYIEPTYIFSAIRNGAKFTKKGKGSIQTDVVATLQVLDDVVLIDRHFPNFPNGHDFDIKTVEPPPREKDQPVYMDVCSVKNPATKARNVRYRVGCSKGWKCRFNILWDKTIINRSQMEAVLTDTGTLVGVGDGRSIGYGRFSVVSFDITE